MPETSAVNAFAFQTGCWQVRHRKLRTRLSGDSRWVEFGGTCQAWEILAGTGNLDDHWLDDPEGAYAAATVRRLEPDGNWAIWWIDSRRADLDSAMLGGFEDGIGLFYGTDTLDGKRIDVRFSWSEIATDSARWEQAFSPDQGNSWETNWVMDFLRLSTN